MRRSRGQAVNHPYRIGIILVDYSRRLCVALLLCFVALAAVGGLAIRLTRTYPSRASLRAITE
jgi:hypothetical protein